MLSKSFVLQLTNLVTGSVSVFFVCFVFFFFKLINLFLAALGLRCGVWAFSSCGDQGLLFVAVCGLLIAVPSLVAEHRL